MIIRATTPASCQARIGNTIQVPRQTSFRVPRPGSYSSNIRAVTRKLKHSGDSSTRFIRFLLNVIVPGSNIDYLAKLDLKEDLHEGSELWNVLCRLIGRARLQELSGSSLDLDSLVGLPCDIEVDYVYGIGEHDFPLVMVTNIQPAGTLVKAERSRN